MPVKRTFAARSEKGLLTPKQPRRRVDRSRAANAVRVGNTDRQSLINNTVALAKASKVFDVPVVLRLVKRKASAATRPS